MEHVSHLVSRLSDSELDLTGSRFGELTLPAPQLAQKLVGSVETFEQAADELAREERRTEAMKLAKDDALSAYSTSFLWIARTVESLCRLAGLDEVAKRVRPAVRRPGVTARKFEEPTDESSEGSAEAGASEGEGSTESTSEVAATEARRSSE